ncbi:MAG: NAD-dependent epimerase/dehydratase family protein [Gemmatimonadaceae bacterium]
MIVAITGANGFIGRHLVQRFTHAGWTTRAITRRDFATGAVDDLTRGADVVVHAAGATRAPSVAQLRESNVALTQRMLDVARAAAVRRFVFISSQAAGGPAATLAAPVDENATPSPVEPYGQSKLDAENAVRTASGMATAIVRPAAVYGPGDRDFLAMFKLARRGAAIHPGNRDHWLSIIHAHDVADAVLTCATSTTAIGQTYFFANDEPVQWAELFRLGAECAERTLRLDVNVPEPIVKIGAAIGDLTAAVTGRASLFTSGKVALSKPAFWICSNLKARRELSFSPKIDLRRGLGETYAWYRANKWL